MALNYIICLLDLIARLATRNADTLLLRIIYGKRTAQARNPYKAFRTINEVLAVQLIKSIVSN